MRRLSNLCLKRYTWHQCYLTLPALVFKPSDNNTFGQQTNNSSTCQNNIYRTIIIIIFVSLSLSCFIVVPVVYEIKMYRYIDTCLFVQLNVGEYGVNSPRLAKHRPERESEADGQDPGAALRGTR